MVLEKIHTKNISVDICLSSLLSPEKCSKKPPLCLDVFTFLNQNFTLFVGEIPFFGLHLYGSLQPANLWLEQ